MRIRLVMAVSVAALVSHSVAEARPGDRLRERIAERRAERMEARGSEDAPRLAGAETIAYGRDPLQNLDIWVPKRADAPAPLLVFVHGGGWQRGSKDNATGRYKAPHYTGLGYAFASINYRLVPGASVEQQAEDVASALKAVLDRADNLGIDRRRVVLMGHSAGAHLVALVGTDPRYLQGAGLSLADIRGVVPIDGAAYDVPSQIDQAGRYMRSVYDAAFGQDAARQQQLSPVHHAAAPNAPAFLLLHVQRKDGVEQNDRLAKALRDAGTTVQQSGVPGDGLKGHAEINRQLGDPDYAPTLIVDRWLAQLLAGS